MSRCPIVAVAVLLLAIGLLPVASAVDGVTPDLRLTATPSATSVLPGATAEFLVTIGNDALVDRQARLNVTSLPPDYTYQFVAYVVNVKALSNNSTTLSIVVPAGARPGTLEVPFEARDTVTDQWTRATLNLTIREAPPGPAPTTDPGPLVELAISQGDAEYENGTARGLLTIRNLDAISTRISTTTSAGPTDGWSPVVGTKFAFIDRSGVTTIPLSVKIPALDSSTTKVFRVVVDADNGVRTERRTIDWVVTGVARPAGDDTSAPAPAETTSTSGASEDAPSGPGAIASRGPGLDVLVTPLEATIVSGEEAVVNVRLNNTGGTPLTIELIGTQPLGWPDFGFSPPVATLAPGESLNVATHVRAPDGIPPGGKTDARVTARANGVLYRSADFVLTVVPGAPRDTSTAAAVETPATPDGGLNASSGPSALLIVGLAAVGSGAALVLSRPLREKAIWLGVGLYTRLARPDVLGHEDREKLYRLVETTPGIHFHALQRELGWNTGTLTYHLRVLERHGFLVSRRDGLYRRFYLSGAAPRKEVFENQGPTGLRADVMEAIRNTPGISQSDLALGLNSNKQTVNYHVKALERAGTIRVEKRGRDTFLFPMDAPSPPGPAPARV